LKPGGGISDAFNGTSREEQDVFKKEAPVFSLSLFFISFVSV
jgi:hypothetical protein